LWTHLIPATIEGKATHNVQNAMFAAALAYSMNKDLDQIRHGLRTFDATFFQAPGRMNQYDEHPYKVILDYGHNPAAVKVVCQTIDKFEIAGKKICVLSAPGDRRDQDILEIAQQAYGHFDHYILKADDDRRGRDDREVPLMLQQKLLGLGANENQIEVIADEIKAIDHALKFAKEGDLLLIFGDQITRCWKQIISFNSENQKSNSPSNDNIVSSVIVDEDENEIIKSMDLIKDERGVRLARVDEDSD
jgi:cyanophycin synthetase